MSFNDIRENKILAKISESTVAKLTFQFFCYNYPFMNFRILFSLFHERIHNQELFVC